MRIVVSAWICFAAAGLVLAQDANTPGQDAQQNGSADPSALRGPGRDVTMPQLLSKTEPSYTDEARRAGVNAVVLMSLIVRQDGTPTRIKVIRGAGFGLDEMAIQALQTWRFDPAKKNGAPVAIQANVEMNFRLLVGGHQNQAARLNFTLPADVERPELIKGEIPKNPPDAGDKFVRIHLTVGRKGKPDNVQIISASDPEWAGDVMDQVRRWHFSPAMLNSEPQQVDGLFELVIGHPKLPAGVPGQTSASAAE